MALGVADGEWLLFLTIFTAFASPIFEFEAVMDGTGLADRPAFSCTVSGKPIEKKRPT